MSENQQALNHVVSMEDLTVDQVMKLIKRGIEFKNGAQIPYEDHPIVSNLFLRILHGRISPLKWQRLNWGWSDLTLM